MAGKPRGPAAIAQLERERERRASLTGRIGLANAGDTESAEWLLQLAVHHLGRCADGEGSIPPELAEWLGMAIQGVLCGKDPGIALGLKARKTQAPLPDYWKLERDADLARGVQYHRDQGMTYDDAIDAVAASAQGFNRLVGFEAVKKAYDRFHSKKDQGKR